jgi:hypothetical protein
VNDYHSVHTPLPAVGAAEHPTDHQQEDFRQRIDFVALNAKVRNRSKMFEDAGRHEKLLRGFLE